MNTRFKTLALIAGSLLASNVSADSTIQAGGLTTADEGRSSYTADQPTSANFANIGAPASVTASGGSVANAGRDWNWNSPAQQMPLHTIATSVELFGRR